MRLYSDTSPEIEAIQVQIWRKLGTEGRLGLTLQLADDAHDLSRFGIRARHPDYSDREVENALRLMLLGEVLFRNAWPDESLRSP